MVPFGLVFAAAGLGCWFGGLGMCAWTQRMRSWEPGSARIVSVAPSDGTVSYEYRRDGQVFAGTFRPDEDDPPRFREPGREVPVRIHPGDPSRSHVGEVRATPMSLWLGVFALTHGSVGLGLMAGGIAAFRSERRRAGLRRRWPGEPWKWRPDWEQGHAAVESPWGASRWLWAYAALAWNSLAWWTTWLLLGESGGSGRELVAGFGAMGAGLVPAWMAWRGFRAEGESRAWVVRFPARGLALGEDAVLAFVDGARSRSAAVPRAGQEAGAVHAWRLRCVQRAVRGQGEDSVARTRELWAGEVAERTVSAAETELTVRLPSGAGVGGTTAWGSGEDGVRWELAAVPSGKRGGERIFLLPVFRGADGLGGEAVLSGPTPPWPDEAAEIPEAEARAAAYAAEKIGIERGPRSLRCSFPRRRHAMPATTSLILGTAFGGVGVVALWPFLPLPWPVRGFLGIFGAAGAVLLRAALRQNATDTVVDAEPGRLRVTERCLGWTFAREWTGDEILGWEVGSAGSYNNVPFEVVRVMDASGRKHTVTPLFASRSAARALAGDLEATVRGAASEQNPGNA
jgi:hypothetical protein